MEVTTDMMHLIEAYADLPAGERAQFLREVEVRAVLWRMPGFRPPPLGPRAPHPIEVEDNPYAGS
jgi:hypothetical protein